MKKLIFISLSSLILSSCMAVESYYWPTCLSAPDFESGNGNFVLATSTKAAAPEIQSDLADDRYYRTRLINNYTETIPEEFTKEDLIKNGYIGPYGGVFVLNIKEDGNYLVWMSKPTTVVSISEVPPKFNDALQVNFATRFSACAGKVKYVGYFLKKGRHYFQLAHSRQAEFFFSVIKDD